MISEQNREVPETGFSIWHPRWIALRMLSARDREARRDHVNKALDHSNRSPSGGTRKCKSLEEVETDGCCRGEHPCIDPEHAGPLASLLVTSCKVQLGEFIRLFLVSP
jgi:hypothetical protein